LSGILQSTLPLTQLFACEYLQYYRVLPLDCASGVLRVAASGEPDPDVLHDLESSFGARVELIDVGADSLLAAIQNAFKAEESVDDLVRDLSDQFSAVLPAEIGGPGTADARAMANQPPVIRFVNLLIREAHRAGASDIHLEATAAGLRVRVRIDGVLSELPTPPPSLQAAVLSRVKLLAELDIAERRKPLDGRVRVRLEERELDIRVATVPTLYGESVVLRLLEQGGRRVGLDELGMSHDTLHRVRGLAAKPHGIVLATGPTGSGKTTTLYAALALRDPTAEKVITVEDPVEYQVPGVTQVPVHAQTGMTFASALRSLLRQDPDVLMVGEMRDAETASVAIQAAMTGHLVFSSVHTNDAISALTRLMDLKVEPYMIAAALEGVLAQRLVRRTCPDCREAYTPDPAMVALIAERPVAHRKLQRGRGCDACRQTGFRGRIGIFELLLMSDRMRDLLLGTPDIVALRRTAREDGLIPLRQDAWQKVQAGLTTVEEVLRVISD
jgi:general secretion pathway protein E